VCTSDAGCDGPKPREYLRNAAYDQPGTIFWEVDCLGRVRHLIGKKPLATVQACAMNIIPCTRKSYFGSLAMLVNVWRERSIQVYKAYEQLFGEERAK